MSPGPDEQNPCCDSKTYGSSETTGSCPWTIGTYVQQPPYPSRSSFRRRMSKTKLCTSTSQNTPSYALSCVGRPLSSASSNYPGCDENSLVSTILTNDQQKLVTSAFLATQLQAAAKHIGEDVLGYSHLDIGTHSIRSGGAMAMYLVGVPVFTIMLIGRWSSDAFLWYIGRQVLQFRMGVSKRMISTKSQDFFTLPDFDPEHPRTRAHQTNFQYSPQQSGPARRPSTPDHVFESLLPRVELSI
jgi:hypothetical protein